MSTFYNIFVKILLAVALVAGGFFGMNAVLNPSSSKTTQTTSEKAAEEETVLTPEQKLLVLMANADPTKQPGINADQLRAGTYEITAPGPAELDRSRSVSSITASAVSPEMQSIAVENYNNKSAKLYTVSPNLAGANSFLTIEDDKAMYFASQNTIDLSHDYSIMGVSMTTDEMTDYYKKNKDSLDELISKIIVSDELADN